MLTLFGGALAVFLVYATLLWWGLRRSRSQVPQSTDAAQPPISVVVAARNEATRLPALLDALDQQTHPAYEVILVDDGSTDETNAIASEWATDRSYATVVEVTSPSPPRKKNAISKGIDAANHDLLAFTDADCEPPPDWLTVLSDAHARTDDDLVLVGYSPVVGNGLLGTYARYETLVEALYTAAAVGLGRPYMAVGRNLSYPRSVFEKVGGFSHPGGGQESMSGDDDLFVQAVHQQGIADVRVLFDERSFVPTHAPSSWRAWVRKRRRHVSAGRHYPRSTSIHLTLLHGSLVLLWLAPLALGLRGLGLLATALLARHSSLGPAADAFEETDLLALFPLWELGYMLYNLTVVPMGLLRPPKEWAGNA